MKAPSIPVNLPDGSTLKVEVTLTTDATRPAPFTRPHIGWEDIEEVFDYGRRQISTAAFVEEMSARGFSRSAAYRALGDGAFGIRIEGRLTNFLKLTPA